MANIVKFDRKQNFAAATGSSADANTIYFTQDTHEVVIGGQIYGTAVPKAKHNLIYSDDDKTLTYKQLMINDGLVVNTLEDLNRCKTSSDFSMKQVADTWVRHNFNPTDPVSGSNPSTYAALGTNEAARESGLCAVNAWHYVDKEGVDHRLYNNATGVAPRRYTLSNGEIQDYIYNFNNPSLYTFLLSGKSYSSYYSKLSVGVEPSHNTLNGYTDRIVTIPMNVTENSWMYQIEIYSNNYNDDYESWIKSGNCTVGIAVRKVQVPFTGSTSGQGTAVAIVTGAEGLDIVPYDSAKSNYPAGAGYAMIVETLLYDNVLTVAFSDPYLNDGTLHDDEISVLTARKVTIDLSAGTVEWKDKNNTQHSKNFKTGAGCSGYSNADKAYVLDVFDHLCNKEVHRAFMQESTPGAIWKNVKTLDGNLIFAFNPEDETIYRFNGSSWENLNQHPLTKFTGSRIAYNDVTKKLFYSDGSIIREIGSNGIIDLPTANATVLGCVKLGYVTDPSGKNYAIQIDSNGNLYVNVPWDAGTNSTYKLTLNGTEKGTTGGTDLGSFYAPTAAGTSGQYLKSNGSGAPVWANFPTIPTITLNGAATTSPSFYAPTAAGTSGYYLKSNGSGAPVWAQIPAGSDTTYKLTLNGTEKGTTGGTDLGSFYAPTAAGTSGQYLKSNGSGAPVWANFPTIPAAANDANLKIQTDSNTAWNIFSADASSDSTLKFKGTLGVSLLEDSTNKTITITGGTHHKVLSKTEIARAKGSLGRFYIQEIECENIADKLYIANLYDVYTKDFTGAANYTTYSKTTVDDDYYIGLFGANSTAGLGAFRVKVHHDDGYDEYYKFLVIEDTPSNGTFVFVTDLPWEFVCRHTGSDNKLFCFAKLPNTFKGNVTVTPIRCHITSGGNWYSFATKTNSTTVGGGIGYVNGSLAHPINNGFLTGNSITITSHFTLSTINTIGSAMDRSSSGFPENPSGAADAPVNPMGKYTSNVNMILDLGDIKAGDYITDFDVNDTLLHELEATTKNHNIRISALENGGGGTSTIPVGTIQMYAGTTAPDGWLLCNGEYVSLGTGSQGQVHPEGHDEGTWYGTKYQNLINLIGSTYGVSGNQYGTKYRLPDFRLKFPIGGTQTKYEKMQLLWDDPNLIPSADKTISGFGTMEFANVVASDGSKQTSTLPSWATSAEAVRRYTAARDAMYDRMDSTITRYWGVMNGQAVTSDGEYKHRLTASESGIASNAMTGISTDEDYAYPGTSAQQHACVESITAVRTPQDAIKYHNNVPPYLAVNFIIKC